MAEPRYNALYPRQSDALVENWAAGTRPETLSAYQEPWYRALPNYLTGLVHGPDSTMAQANTMRHLAGTENPLNLPGQFSEGLDTAAQGYKLGNPTMTGAGLFGAMSSLPIPGFKGVGQAVKQEAKGVRPSGDMTYHRGVGSPDNPFAGYFPDNAREEKLRGAVFFTKNPDSASSYSMKRSPHEYGDDGYRTYGDGATVIPARLNGDLAQNFESYDAQRHIGVDLTGDGREVVVFNRDAITSPYHGQKINSLLPQFAAADQPATIESLRKYGLLPPMLAAGAAGAGSNALYDGINNQ